MRDNILEGEDEMVALREELDATHALLKEALEREEEYERSEAKVISERDEALDMVNEARQLLAIVHRDGGHHTEAVGFAQSCRDAMQVYWNLQSQFEEGELAELNSVAVNELFDHYDGPFDEY